MKAADQASEALWRVAWADIREGKWEEAAERLEKLAHKKLNPMERNRLEYWKIRLQEEQKKTVKKEVYEEFVMHPSFYGLVMLDRLGRKPKFQRKLLKSMFRVARGRRSGGYSSEVTKDVVVQSAARMYRMGLEKEARGALVGYACAQELPAEQLRTVGRLLEHMGAPELAYRIQKRKERDWLAGPLHKKNIAQWFALYPKPYWQLFEEVAKKEKIDPFLHVGLVRTESMFDAKIVSWAGATGLGQLMPGTAKQAYVDVFHRRLRNRSLTDPGLNLRLSARVLKDGLRSFRKNPLLAAANYNGGPRIARKFDGRDKSEPLEYWIENLPVKETRKYIRKVFQSYAVYKLLHDPKIGVRNAKLPFPRR